jgi:hypothetical protein
MTPGSGAGDDGGARPGAEWQSAEVIESPPARRGASKLLGILLVVLALAVGGTFAFRSIRTSSSGGSSTPDGAVRNFLAAVGNEDVLGVLGTLVPGERDAIRKPAQDLVTELIRLKVLGTKASLSKIGGVNFEFKNVTLKSTPLDADHAFVETTGGTVTVSLDPRAAPLGSLVRDLARDARTSKPHTETETLTGDNAIRLVALRQAGTWYTSIFFSIAENARRDKGGPVPDLANIPAATGESSPEAAARTMLNAIADFDLQRALGLLAPDESAAMRAYSSMFLQEMTAAAAGWRRSVHVTLKNVGFSARSEGDASVVKITHIELSVKTTKGVDVEYDGSCLISKGLPFAPPKVCGDQLRRQAGLLGKARQAPDIGFVVVRRDGAWYVSPTRTFLEAITGALRTLTPQDLRDVASLVTRFAAGFSASTTLSTSTTVSP